MTGPDASVERCRQVHPSFIFFSDLNYYHARKIPSLSTHEHPRRFGFRFAAPVKHKQSHRKLCMLAYLKPTILASDLGQGGQAGCVCHKLNASRSHRQTRKEQGLPPRRPGPGTPLPLDNPDCLPPYYMAYYMKLVNPIEASIEPSAISPWGAKWRDVDIGIYKPLV